MTDMVAFENVTGELRRLLRHQTETMGRLAQSFEASAIN